MPFLAAILAALRLFNVANLLAAAQSDVRRRIIPNAIAASIFAGELCLQLAADPLTLWASMIVGAALYVMLVEQVHLGLIGGGDAKLASASSFLVPVGEVAKLLVDIALAGGVLCIAYIVARRLAFTSNPSLPYGVAIAVGSTFRIIADIIPCSGATSCW